MRSKRGFFLLFYPIFQLQGRVILISNFCSFSLSLYSPFNFPFVRIVGYLASNRVLYEEYAVRLSLRMRGVGRKKTLLLTLPLQGFGQFVFSPLFNFMALYFLCPLFFSFLSPGRHIYSLCQQICSSSYFVFICFLSFHFSSERQRSERRENEGG